MATESLSILIENGTANSLLAVKYGPVIENIQNNTLFSELRNMELSGDPQAGTVNARRFVNASLNDYGVARSGRAGAKIKAADVPVNINQHKEIIEEVEDADVRMYGVDGLISRRVQNHQLRLVKALEKAFWAEAQNGGTEFTPTASAVTIGKKVDEAIVRMETMKTDYVDGVDRSMMTLVLSPSAYTELQEHVDTLPGVNGQTYQVFHGAPVRISTDLPDGVQFFVIVKGAVALPFIVNLDELGKVPLSNSYHFGVFLDFGVKTVSPELVIYVGTGESPN